MKIAKYFLLAATTLNLIVPTVTANEETPTVLITEVSTGNSDSSSYEYVEIVNTTNTEIDITGWKIEYLSAGGTNWLKKAESDIVLPAKSHALFASQVTSLDSDATLATGLSATGGHVRLVNSLDVELDRLGWGSGESAETISIEKAANNQVYKRTVDEDGEHIDTDNNQNDFILSTSPTPTKSINRLSCELAHIEPIAEETEPEEIGAEEAETTTYYPPLKLTELFIDPKSPATDKEDEFVELFNPNGFTVNIEGYIIESGKDFNYSFALPSYELKPGEYIAVFSADSKLTLTNSGGMARLVDPNNVEVSITAPYPKAKQGKSWSVFGSSWGWTNPTPHQKNVLEEALDQEEPEETTGVLAKRTPNPQVLSLQTDSEQEASTLTDKENLAEPPAAKTRELNNSILVTLAVLALLYGGYEYRKDIASLFQKLRRYIYLRRKPSQEL